MTYSRRHRFVGGTKLTSSNSKDAVSDFIGNLPNPSESDTAAQELKARQERERSKQEHLTQLFDAQGIAPRYRKMDFSRHPATKDRKGDMLEYLKSGKGFLLLTGPCGTGKTTVVMAMAVTCVRKDRPWMFRVRNCEELYNQWLDEVRSGSPNNLFQSLIGVDILILDDFGQGSPSEGFIKFLYSVINRRWEWEQRTVFTTNLNSEDLAETFGNSVISRLAEGSVWKFSGEDHRLNKRITT